MARKLPDSQSVLTFPSQHRLTAQLLVFTSTTARPPDQGSEGEERAEEEEEKEEDVAGESTEEEENIEAEEEAITEMKDTTTGDLLHPVGIMTEVMTGTINMTVTTTDHQGTEKSLDTMTTTPGTETPGSRGTGRGTMRTGTGGRTGTGARTGTGMWTGTRDHPGTFMRGTGTMTEGMRGIHHLTTTPAAVGDLPVQDLHHLGDQTTRAWDEEDLCLWVS